MILYWTPEGGGFITRSKRWMETDLHKGLLNRHSTEFQVASFQSCCARVYARLTIGVGLVGCVAVSGFISPWKRFTLRRTRR